MRNVRIRLGSYYLQSQGGWGQREDAKKFQLDEAKKKVDDLKRFGVAAEIEESIKTR